MDIFKENLDNFSKFSQKSDCVSKLLYIVNRSSSKKEQLKLHRYLLNWCERGGGQKQPYEPLAYGGEPRGPCSTP